MHDATLCFLVDERKGILLGLKKRGFAQGVWNGYGGKVEGFESIEEAAARELAEESGVTVKIDELEKVAVLSFCFADEYQATNWNQRVHVFVARQWSGQIRETEEMRPQWYGFSELPFEEMWSDDIHWLPRVLAGHKLEGSFRFNSDNKTIAEYVMKEVDGF